jgi:hypothetical protein
LIYSVVRVEDNLYRIDRVSSYKLNKKGINFNSYVEAEAYVEKHGYLYTNTKLNTKKRPFSSNKNIKNIW